MSAAYERHHARHYCLYCLRTLHDTDVCGACGRTSRHVDRTVYWNLVPSFRRLEVVLKVLGVFVSIFGTVALLPILGGASGGFVCFLPAAMIVATWKSASKLTRHEPYFHPVYLWTPVPLLAGLTVGVLVDPWYFALALPTPLVWLWCRDAARWKRRLIEGVAR